MPIKLFSIFILLASSFSLLANPDYDEGIVLYNKKEYSEALPYFKKAAKEGHAGAQARLGLMYNLGWGVTRDNKLAVSWYTKAAEQGHAEAQTRLGYLYNWTKDYKVAVSWYTKAAEQGYAEAQNRLGWMYEKGLSVTQDYKVALSWYTKSAEQSHADAYESLGLMYENGLGVTQDHKIALSWYKKMAEQENEKWAIDFYTYKKLVLNCPSAGNTKLFDLALRCANRDELMAAVKNAGARVKNENKNNWGDIYFTDNILQGSSELSIDYTVDNHFAYARYTFPSRKDIQMVSVVRNFVSKKYGDPDVTGGGVSLDNVSYWWHLEDGIMLEVTRGLPDTATYLSYKEL